MQAWINFLTTDYGLMSAGVILFMLGMGGFFARYVSRHVKEDTERHDRLVREGKVANRGTTRREKGHPRVAVGV